MTTPCCKLLPGMPVVGLGVWKAEQGVTENIVYEAIKLGYRHIDGACDYGNEKEVGAGIKRAIGEGLVKREELWITSKLWNTFHRKENVPLACQRSLDDMGLDYVDLYLIHFPISLEYVPFDKFYPPQWCTTPNCEGVMKLDDVPYSETWTAMEALKDAGKAKHIGVSNVNCQMIMDILRYCKHKPEVLQVELHLYLQQKQLVEFCHTNGISVTGYSPLGPISYVPLGGADASENLLTHATVMDIAAARGKTAAQVCLRFQVQRGVVIIPKSTQVARLKENMDVCSWELTAEDVTKLEALEKGRRYNDPAVYCKFWGWPQGYPIFA